MLFSENYPVTGYFSDFTGLHQICIFLHRDEGLLFSYDMTILFSGIYQITRFFRIFPGFFSEFSSYLQISSYNRLFNFLIWYDYFVFRKIIRCPDFQDFSDFFPDFSGLFPDFSGFFLDFPDFFSGFFWIYSQN